MAKRITITVPDEVYEKVQKRKEFINISSVCSDALARVVASLEFYFARNAEERDAAILDFSECHSDRLQALKKGGEAGLDAFLLEDVNFRKLYETEDVEPTSDFWTLCFGDRFLECLKKHPLIDPLVYKRGWVLAIVERIRDFREKYT